MDILTPSFVRLSQMVASHLNYNTTIAEPEREGMLRVLRYAGFIARRGEQENLHILLHRLRYRLRETTRALNSISQELAEKEKTTTAQHRSTIVYLSTELNKSNARVSQFSDMARTVQEENFVLRRERTQLVERLSVLEKKLAKSQTKGVIIKKVRRG